MPRLSVNSEFFLPKLSDYNPPPLAPPARGGDLYRYSLPLDGESPTDSLPLDGGVYFFDSLPLDGGGLGWGCLIINSTSSMIILLGITQLRYYIRYYILR